MAGVGHARKLDRVFAGGVAWSAGAKAVTQLLTWASVLVAARLLSPADFGLTAMAGVFLNVTNVMAEFGIGTAVLQMQELEPEVVAQLHSFSCLLCAAIFLAAEAISPLIAAFFKSKALLTVLVVNNLAFIITGFQQIPLALMQREMDYRRISLSEAASACVQAVATIVCAVAGLGYWSLVIALVLAKATYAGLNYYWQPSHFRAPRWREIRKAVAMGGQIAVSRLAWSTYTQSDALVVGRTLGDARLGIYQMAMMLASAPSEKIGTMVMRATGPLFAKVQNDQALVRRYFLIVMEALALTVLPLMVGLALVAPDAVQVVLGKKWSSAATPLIWLALFVMLRTSATVSDQVLVSLRYTRFTMAMALLNLALMPAAFLVASRSGVSAVAASWLVLAPITVIPFVVKLAGCIRLRYRELRAALMPALAGCAAMAVAVALARLWTAGLSWPAYIRLGAQIAVGAAAYAAVVLGPYRGTILRYIRFLRSLREEGGEIVSQ
jgi:O-antigen/teichoic acid export membrane protein